MAEPIEAVVVEGGLAAMCEDCQSLISLFRLRVTASVRCAGIEVWAIPTHTAHGRPCPGNSYREAAHA